MPEMYLFHFCSVQLMAHIYLVGCPARKSWRPRTVGGCCKGLEKMLFINVQDVTNICHARRNKKRTTTTKSSSGPELQKLDNDFIDNCITFLFYTYFINDTRFYICFFANITASCRLEREKKRKSNKTRGQHEIFQFGLNLKAFF